MNSVPGPVTIPTPRTALCYIVDDMAVVGASMCRAVSKLGWRAKHVPDIAGLISEIASKHPSIIFLDVHLGKDDAIGALRSLADARYRGGVQLMSGRAASAFEDVLRVGTNHGLRMFQPLTKPFRAERLLSILREADTDVLEVVPGPIRHVPAAPADPSMSLNEALGQERLDVWYQPKIELKKMKVSGLECLARVRLPSGEIVGPSGMLRNASTAAMRQLTGYVMDHATESIAEFREIKRDIGLAVNVPVSSFCTMDIPDLAERFKFDKVGSQTSLTLEITEDEAIRYWTDAHEFATRLKIHGIRVAIDDFGTGHSSFARLRDIPFGMIKLDKSFVRHCDRDARNAALCQTIIELAERLGAVTVAEGVETEGELATLRAMGCGFAQGFFLARPMPKADALRFVKDGWRQAASVS